MRDSNIPNFVAGGGNENYQTKTMFCLIQPMCLYSGRKQIMKIASGENMPVFILQIRCTIQFTLDRVTHRDTVCW